MVVERDGATPLIRKISINVILTNFEVFLFVIFVVLLIFLRFSYPP